MEEGLLESLDKDSQIILLEKLIGMTDRPVSIDQFIHDDYYLGSICGIDPEYGHEQTYKVWRDALDTLFPNPFMMKSSFICNTGGIGCVVGSTPIRLSNNEVIKIRDLYKDKDNYINKLVYSYDTVNNRPVLGKIDDIHYTGRKNTVTINDSITCTSDHKFLLTNGYYKRADELKYNDRIVSISNFSNVPKPTVFTKLDLDIVRLSYIMCEEYGLNICNKDESVDYLNYLRKQLILKGYITNEFPKYSTIDEFIESINYCIRSEYTYDYKNNIKHTINISNNKIYIKDIVNIAKKYNTFNYVKLSQLLECSIDKISTIISQYYDSIEDFARENKITYCEDIKVTSIKKNKLKSDVYDMTIKQYHNYGIYNKSNNSVLITHNTGKSNCAKIIILYTIYKMSCCKDFFRFNRLTPRELVIGVSHNNKFQANDVIKDLKQMMEESPYFVEQLNNKESLISKYIKFVSCRSPTDFVGTNMPIWFGTELNDYKPQDRATELIDAAISRIESRFRRSLSLFSCIILDSSDRGVDSAVPNFIKKNPYGREAVQFRYSQWEAKPTEYWHKPDKNRIDNYEYLIDSQGRKIKNENFGKPALSFRVYCGDAEIHPCIIDENIDKDVLEKMDPDRFIDVPNDVRNAFENNIELALQEKCGRATESSNQYFNPSFLTPAFDIDARVHSKFATDNEDIICCSFFDDNDQYFNYLESAIELLPKNRPCFFGLDLGLSKDKCGVAIGYIQDVGEHNLEGIVTYDPIYYVPIAFAISRNPGEETSIQKIINLIQWLHSKRTIYSVSTDHFQSYGIEQACISAEIKHEFISVDSSTEPWKLTKDALYRNKLHMTKNTILKNELLNVFYDEDKHKVDHHQERNPAGDVGSDSKDIADAVVKVIYSMRNAVTENLDDAINPRLVSESMIYEQQKTFIEGLRKLNMQRQFKEKFGKQLSSMRFE